MPWPSQFGDDKDDVDAIRLGVGVGCGCGHLARVVSVPPPPSIAIAVAIAPFSHLTSSTPSTLFVFHVSCCPVMYVCIAN